MSDRSRLILTRLGLGESIEQVCTAAGISRAEFDAWWQETVAARTPRLDGSRASTVRGNVEIVRDSLGIPHIFAADEADLFVGFGWAMAQDRLWQLDYLRRKSLGRLAEILGAEAVAQDTLVRTVGVHRIAAAELPRLPRHTRHLLEAFAQGINEAMREAIAEGKAGLPIEFALLDYAPEAWTPLDSVAIWGEFRWYLTGRMPVIAYPELARRKLGSDALYRAFLTPEAGDESIVPAGMYPARRAPVERVGAAVGDPQEGQGSNNWTVNTSRSATGGPLLASDPHIAFGTLSCWVETHLTCDAYNTVGMAYVGVPAVVMGRNEHVAWGLTNNICSQRDLYEEKSDPQHPNSFFYDGKWEPIREITETIAVRDRAPVTKTIRFSRNGPLVDELLPKPLQELGPVSLRWLGAEFCDELSCMNKMQRARSSDEFREALRGWLVPTFNFIFADRAGHIGYQAVGRIPVRAHWERGFRPGWEAAHQWQEVIPFDGMPAIADPPSGWIRTANNRNAPEDFPYPLSGTWASGHRAERIRHMLEEQPRFGVDDFRRMHLDVLARRAVAAVPPLLVALEGIANSRVQQAIALLRRWDARMEPDRVGATIFEVFFRHWSQMVADERFDRDVAALMAGVVGGLALELLSEDTSGWFAQGDRIAKIGAAFEHALDEIETRLGKDPARWQWGNLHTITLRHLLSDRGELSQLLDRGGYAVGGNGYTVCNTGYVVTDAGYEAAAGANYRLIADLGNVEQGLWASDSAGISGNPGSAHYCDQLTDWLAGNYHFLPLDRAAIVEKARLTLQPRR